ncbi:hypothetical protein T265_04077 [Opisthorchis viverrini]|uniref:Uncharacterized protein n=1 Tax=Opisthorchis viverrini TaxID=6198 RepID=A0A074ZP95_OPIVI|nr:hypothetical protein T265_04077 [Opisthorchis viverrini]KER29228.1 hypothetical protein T265_04077 [Opisthorchis viverrini]
MFNYSLKQLTPSTGRMRSSSTSPTSTKLWPENRIPKSPPETGVSSNSDTVGCSQGLRVLLVSSAKDSPGGTFLDEIRLDFRLITSASTSAALRDGLRLRFCGTTVTNSARTSSVSGSVSELSTSPLGDDFPVGSRTSSPSHQLSPPYSDSWLENAEMEDGVENPLLSVSISSPEKETESSSPEDTPDTCPISESNVSHGSTSAGGSGGINQRSMTDAV